MRNNNNEIEIEGLPKGIYVLKAIGNLRPRGDNLPEVEVILGNVFDSKYDKLLRAGEKTTIYEKSFVDKDQRYFISVRFIPLLRIGCVFRDGKRINTNLLDTTINLSIFNPLEHKPQKLYNLLGKHDFENIFGGLSSEEREKSKNQIYKIAFSQHAIYANYLKIPVTDFKSSDKVLADVDYLLIPSYEILRFYYLRSDNIIDAVFSDPTVNENLFFEREESDFLTAKTGKNTIILKSKMLLDDALVIYRMMYDEDANRQLTYFRILLSSDYYYENRATFYGGIPYYDKIKLNVSGIKLNLMFDPDEGYVNIYLVNQILVHHDQWNIDSLEILKEVTRSNNSQTNDKKRTPRELGEIADSVKLTDLVGKKYPSSDRKFIVADEEDSQNCNRVKVKIGYIERLEIGDELKTEYYDIYTGKEESNFSLLDKTENGDDALRGARITTNEIEKNKYIRDKEEDLDKTMVNISNALSYCEDKFYTKVKPTIYRKCYKISSPFVTLFPKEMYWGGKKNKELAWLFCFYDWKKKEWINERPIVFIEINSGNNYCYIYKLRPKYYKNTSSPKYIKTSNNERLTEEDIKELLLHMAESSSDSLEFDNPESNIDDSKKNDKKKLDFFKTKINKILPTKIADTDSIEDYANKLYKKIKETLSF